MNWIFFSCSLIIFNKWILAESGFPFPLALTMCHMAFCSCFAAAMRAGVLRARTFGPGVRVARARAFVACEEEALFAPRGELELPVRCPGPAELLSFLSM